VLSYESLLSHASINKKNKRKINNDLAVLPSHDNRLTDKGIVELATC